MERYGLWVVTSVELGIEAHKHPNTIHTENEMY